MRVALYLRRSTNEELQADSLEVQEEILRRFASAHDYAVGPIFPESASGRDAEGRSEFLRLIEIVTTGRADFDAILVRDVSRWGRFDNADEAAYFDFLCLRHGVEVVYVEESFGRDTSPYAGLMKTLKRVQAAEFSREKSRIIRYGKKRGAEHGFRVGAPPPYGMKRVLVHPNGTWIQDLPPKVHKLVSAVKTKLAPAGDATEEVVRRMFVMFTSGLGYSDIGALLTSEGIPGPRGNKWHPASVRYILMNETYTGTATYLSSGAEERIRVEGAHEALISCELFTAARCRSAVLARAEQRSRLKQLIAARAALDRWGHLPADLLTASATTACSANGVITRASEIAETCANVIADEKISISAALAPRFQVVDEGEVLIVNAVVSIRFVIGFTRRDLVGEPLHFVIPKGSGDLVVCVGLDPQLQPAMRCIGRRERVEGKSLIRHPNRCSKSLPFINSHRTLSAAVARLIHRTPAAQAGLLSVAQQHQAVTFRSLAREVGWSAAAVKRAYFELRERREPLPELKYERGLRTTVTCPECGAKRSLVPSDARLLKSNFCGHCSRTASSGKLKAVCPSCGSERFVWPSSVKKMRNGLASLCHNCSLVKGRAITLSRHRDGRAQRIEKYAFLRDLGLLVLRAMTTRTQEFVRPTLWSTQRRRLATIRWHSKTEHVAHRLTLDCDERFVERCRSASHASPTETLATAILDRSRWIGGAKDALGDRVWIVRLT